jgi:hypothetical protein
MADRLYLSFWIRAYTARTMLRHFEKLLRKFPFSPDSPAPMELRVYAQQFSEPPFVERLFDRLAEDVDAVIAAGREFENADCGYIVEGHWDLWRRDPDWKLIPAPVSLACYGPLFENHLGDHLRIEFGNDVDFLPQPEIPGSARKVESNVRGLLRLVHELDQTLPVENRRLWSESGENFAGRLAEALSELTRRGR